MKKILTALIIFSGLSLLFTGCLKDKGFENGQYGINDPDTQPPGVGFPLGKDVKYTIGVDAFSSSPQIINDVIYVNLESGKPAETDVHIVLEQDDAIRVKYNTDNSDDIVKLSSTLYTLPSLNLTIPAGERNVQIPITILNTNSLSTDSSYGVGIKIKSVDGGYLLAGNLKNMLMEFALKNKYDGKYQLNGIHNRPPYNAFPFSIKLEMRTTGANTVAMWLPAPFSDYGQPIGTAPGVVGWYGPAVSPNFQFDLASNICTGVTLQVGAAVTLAMVTSDPVIGPIVNRYDPSSKKMFLTYQYNNNNARRFYDTLTYIGPR